MGMVIERAVAMGAVVDSPEANGDGRSNSREDIHTENLMI